MKSGVKKLLQLGFADIIWSILPILFWQLTGILWGSDYNNGFIIGYSTQFIVMCFREIFCSGALKAWVAENRKVNYFGGGLICYFLVGVTFCILMSVFGKDILSLFGYKDIISQEIYIQYAWMFVIDGIAMYISIYFQYKEQRKLSQIISCSWFFLRVGVLFLCKAFYQDNCIGALKLNNIILFGFAVLLAVFCVNFRNVKIHLRNWISRAGFDISCDIMMFVIYFLGVGNMSGNPAFLTAYNIMSMYTDISWDLQGSIDTYVVLEASEGKWDAKKKKVFASVICYSTFLFLFSLLFILSSGDRLSFWFWLIEMSLFIPDCIGNYCVAYITVKCPGKWLWILGFGNMGARLCMQLLINSLWGIPISCFTGCLLFFAGSALLYRWLRFHETVNKYCT